MKPETETQVERPSDWLSTLRRYLIASVAGHAVWEAVQLPLYTLWSTGTLRQKAFAVLHCTVGDAIIAGLSMLLALSFAGRPSWPETGIRGVYLSSLVLGVVYTIYSEWLNVNIRGSWAYSDLMPVLPLLGTGLSPVLQWIVVPTAAQWFAYGHAPWREAQSNAGPTIRVVPRR